MQFKTAALVLMTVCAATGCKKKGGGGTGGGGGWLVGQQGMMANVGTDGQLRDGYDLGSTETLTGIACKGLETAYVVGEHGTMLRTTDSGESWDSLDIGTAATLRSVAASDTHMVYAVGDGVFVSSPDDGDSWRSVADGNVASWRAVTADWRGSIALAISDDGRVWRYAGSSAQHRATLLGARTIALSHDGAAAVAVGDGVWRSLDGGLTWASLDVGPVELNDAWIAGDGRIIAVGDTGSILNIAVDGTPTLAFPGEKNLRSVHIAADGFGMAGGDDGEVLISRDGGRTWKPGPNVGQTVLALDQIGADHL